MQLVEQHIIKKNDPRYTVIDAACFASKNLYNAANYELRQAFIHQERTLTYNQLDKLMQSHEAYKALPAKVAQWVLKGLVNNWKAFFEARKAYNEDPSKFTGRPSLPKYKDKATGRNLLVYTIIDNLAALASNKPGFTPVVVNGRPAKSMNQFYNKRRAELQQQLGHPGTTARMERLTTKRNRRINHYLHTASRYIIDLLAKEGIGILVIGKNDGWKQAVEMGKRNNQNFVQIPHTRFIQMLSYKARLVGITVLVTEESYTSKASFLDHDPLPVRKPDDETKHTFSGKHVKRGLYRASDGRETNADINGAYNIIRKVAPDAFTAKGVEDGKAMQASLVVHPVRAVIPLTKPKDRHFPVKASGQ
jgi:IS605 OrfB family transposase